MTVVFFVVVFFPVVIAYPTSSDATLAVNGIARAPGVIHVINHRHRPALLKIFIPSSRSGINLGHYSKMNEYKETFLDLSIDKGFYVSRPYFRHCPPIRVLITDAGHKFVYCLIYKICNGEIFGEDQEVYIHLVNARGVIDHKSIFLELEECGFHLLKGWVVTSDEEEAFKDVDVVVMTTCFEEQSGFTNEDTLAGQIIKGRNMIRFVMLYSKPTVRVVLTGSSTKFGLLLLHILHRLEPKFPPENITVVTLLDEAIARAHLAARLKTTTNKIKNIVIWGRTCPDVHNATVRMFPPGDVGALNEVDVPVIEALQDDNYLYEEFVQCIYKRKIGNEFSRSGKSMAIATSRHLKALFEGSGEEIISMGVLTPSSEPCMVPQGLAFSFPVFNTGKGKWKIREDVRYDVRTHLNLIQTVHYLLTNKSMICMEKAVDYILNYEEKNNKIFTINQKQELADLLEFSDWEMKYLEVPTAVQSVTKMFTEKMRMRKSIGWVDNKDRKVEEFMRKSSIKFSSDEVRKRDKAPSILKNSETILELLPLPPISRKQ